MLALLRKSPIRRSTSARAEWYVTRASIYCDFNSNMVLAVVKRGNAFWEYKVEKATVEHGVVRFRYKATSKKTPSTTFSCPLIVSVPKGDYKAVKFIENKKAVKTIEIGAK